MSDLKEKLLASESVFKGKFLEVCVDTVQFPDGKTGTRDCVRHPGAVAVLPVFEDGTVVVVEQYRHAPGRVFIEMPAGKIEPGNSIEETAARELKEETGYEAEQLIHIGKYYPCIGYSDEIIDFFIALNCKPGERELDEDEHLNVLKMPFKELVQQCELGEQMDSKTLAGVIRVRAWWKRKGPFELDLGEL